MNTTQHYPLTYMFDDGPGYESAVSDHRYGMFSAAGDAMLHEAVIATRRVLAAGGDWRLTLQDHRAFIELIHSEVFDSEVGIHLTYAFADAIPDDVRHKRFWMEQRD